jgi:hypothetical protein
MILVPLLAVLMAAQVSEPAPAGLPADRHKAALSAAGWIASRQAPSGWIPSFGEPEPQLAWLWDEALALPALDAAHPDAAARLAKVLLASQHSDGSWPDCFDPATGEPANSEPILGSTAMAAFALRRYGEARDDQPSRDAASRARDWLAGHIRADGSVADSTLTNIAAWWAFAVGARGPEADRVRFYLLRVPLDSDKGWLLARPGDRTLLCDVNSLGAMLLTATRRDGLALSAMTYVRSFLFIRDKAGRPAVGSAGPVAASYEATALYAAARGPNWEWMIATLLGVQRADGAVPHSDRAVERGLAWHTTAPSLAATTWLYYAVEGTPLSLGDGEIRRLRASALVRRGAEGPKPPPEDEPAVPPENR